jgi:hypothetical protein
MMEVTILYCINETCFKTGLAEVAKLPKKMFDYNKHVNWLFFAFMKYTAEYKI